MQAAAARAAIICAFFCMVGVFLPAGRLDVGGKYAAGKTSRSLYQLGKSTGAVRAFLASYHTSVGKKLGARALDKIAPHLKGEARSNAGDVQDALSTLDELRDEDVELVGTVVSVTMWTLLALNLLAIALIYGTGPATARLRMAGALVASVLAAAIAVAVYLVLDRVVVEANLELERELFTLRGGAYVIPATAVASTAAMIASIVGYLRRRAELRTAAAGPR